MFPSHLPTPRRPAAQSIPILRWGIIGPGWIAERFVHSLKTYSRQQVVAVVFRSQAKADRVAAEWGIPQAYGQVEEMLARPDIDAVYIATPHNHHFPDGMQALKAGKHVLIEKPFALNLGEGRELQAEAARQGGQVLRWEEPRNRYDQLFWQAEHFAWCIGQGLQDSPLRPLSRVLQNLQVMDEVRRQVGAVFNEER